ncbi:MJ1477/TM1410 family putative glycoside hydrolase [Mesorhizobium sp. IMUNJ 23232]|uniref:MJ1477/TM1410 family putative glycoside hydrolase n=1 Tax=Mesorhizobium sp. IMUNJ 23232 TaxID=3376064 RepID=UPI0037B2987B
MTLPFLYQLQNTSFSSLSAQSYRAAVIDMDESGLSASQVQTLQGQGKTLFTYLSIGEAEDYRDYWTDGNWDQNKPSFVLGENPDWAGNFSVKFWDPAWQSIMFERVDEAIALGYNGMYLDIVDAYEVAQVRAAYSGSDIRQEMIDFVIALSEYAKAIDPNFKVIPQNAVGLLAANESNPDAPNTAYLNAIDGVGVEDLWYNDNNTSSWTSGDLEFLQNAINAGKFVLATSYPTQDAKQEAFVTNALNAGFVPFVADRDLTGVIDPTNLTIEARMAGLDIDTPWDVALLPIYGTAASETLQGVAGNDQIFGLSGNDTLYGNGGSDALNGGSGNDTASYANATVGVVASLANAAINNGDANGDTYNSVENLIGSRFGDALNGSNGSNDIRGINGDDVIKGYAGNDKLFGQNGNDTLIGGAGADYLSGGSGSDTASYFGATAGVVASLANSSINTGDAAGDTYNSIMSLVGSDFSDTLNGSNGGNRIDGGIGYDTIKGYGGNDRLTGGAGKDDFVFNTELDDSSNVDAIADFNVAADRVQLDNVVFTALTTGALAASAFKDIADDPKDANDRIIYNSDTGILYYDADGSGDAFGNVKFASFANLADLTAADFVVI